MERRKIVWLSLIIGIGVAVAVATTLIETAPTAPVTFNDGNEAQPPVPVKNGAAASSRDSRERASDQDSERSRGDGSVEEPSVQGDSETEESSFRDVSGMRRSMESKFAELRRYSRLSVGGEGAYERLLLTTFGREPSDPIATMEELPEATQKALIGHRGRRLGKFIGHQVPVAEWLNWFELGEFGATRLGQARAVVFGEAVQAKGSRLEDVEAQRVLRQLDRILESWRGSEVPFNASYYAMKSWHEICPVDGGLEFIRKWVVEAPATENIVVGLLVEALKFWRVPECRELALECLSTTHGGAIRGVIAAWRAIDGPYSSRVLWTSSDVHEHLKIPLANAVTKTKSRWGVQDAVSRFTKELLESEYSSIGYGLLERTGSPSIASYGFAFLVSGGDDEAVSLWREWLHSADDRKGVVACHAARHSTLREHVDDLALDRMRDLAMPHANSQSLRAAAGLALAWLERGNRALEVMDRWLDHGEPGKDMLVALGRIATRAPESDVQARLEAMIDDPARMPAERHFPAFLLAVRLPLRAIEICEDRPAAFNPETLLLVSATAEAISPEECAEKAAALRVRTAHPEPGWIAQIRVRDYQKDGRAEHLVLRNAPHD